MFKQGVGDAQVGNVAGRARPNIAELEGLVRLGVCAAERFRFIFRHFEGCLPLPKVEKSILERSKRSKNRAVIFISSTAHTPSLLLVASL